jgi:hypothetical protein
MFMIDGQKQSNINITCRAALLLIFMFCLCMLLMPALVAREQATSQLKATRADEAQTRKMLQILQRMHQHDMDNDDESDSNCTSGSDDEGMSEQLPSALRHLIEQVRDLPVQSCSCCA